MAKQRKRSVRSKRRRRTTFSNVEHFSVHSAPNVPVNVGSNTCACLLLPLTHKWVTELVSSAPYKGGRFKTLSTTVDVVGPTAKAEIYVGIIRTPPDTVKPMGKENDWSLIIRLWRDCYIRRKSTGSSGLACNFNLTTPWMTDDSNEDQTASVFIGWYNDGLTNSRASVDMRVRVACIPNRLWPEGTTGKGHMRNKRGLEEVDMKTHELETPEGKPERKDEDTRGKPDREPYIITTEKEAHAAYHRYGPRAVQWANHIPPNYWRVDHYATCSWAELREIHLVLGMLDDWVDPHTMHETHFQNKRLVWLHDQGCPAEYTSEKGWCTRVWTAFGLSTWQQPLYGGKPIPIGFGSMEAPEISEVQVGMSRLEMAEGEVGGEIIPH
uniref:Putative p43 protein n=1 Tax=Strawberry associated virus A TaxID=2684439 RepID=A0A7S5GJR6_9TOMB|nr:putative p43 protein [Strawberry associated virus A]